MHKNNPKTARKPCPKSGRHPTLIALFLGMTGLFWLVLRSGVKPSRLAYPCQQSALGLAATALGGPVVIAGLAGRKSVEVFFRHFGGCLTILGLALLIVSLGVIASGDDPPPVSTLPPVPGYRPDLFLVNNARGPQAGRFGGVDDLASLMGLAGRPWHRSSIVGPTSGPAGFIDPDDVVLIKINAQWPQRGGTNTDVLRGILRVIVEHPDGFVGEIVVADNGQGSGNLNRSENNAEDHGQSAQDIVNEFAADGWRASTKLWDTFRTSLVSEYSVGDFSDGYIVSSALDPQTQIRVSYPKFRTAWGTYLSYKYGIWDSISSTYDHDRLAIINVPVLKTHSIYGVTAAIKNHMGVITQSLGTDSHAGVGRGGLGSVLAEVRMPDLTILDCIWVLARPGSGPSASYAQSTRLDKILAAFDPVVLDSWAVKNILVPQIVANGFVSYPAQDPDNPSSTFRQYLDRSMNEMLAAQIPCTNDHKAARVWIHGQDIPAISAAGIAMLAVLLLLTGAVLVRRRAGAPSGAGP